MTDPAGRTTIVADASHCPLTQVAGWAAAAVIPGTTEVLGRTEMAPGGWFYSSSSNSAEMVALHNALAWALTAGLVGRCQAVLLATDSSDVHNKLVSRPGRKALWREERGLPPAPFYPLGTPILRLAHEHELALEVCLINGHPNHERRRTSIRARAIAAVDKMSRDIMKAQRKRLFGRLEPGAFQAPQSLVMPQFGTRQRRREHDQQRRRWLLEQAAERGAVTVTVSRGWDGSVGAVDAAAIDLMLAGHLEAVSGTADPRDHHDTVSFMITQAGFLELRRLSANRAAERIASCVRTTDSSVNLFRSG